MRSIVFAAVLALGMGGTVTGAGAAEPDTYLFDVLRHSQYRYELNRVLKGKPVPDWVGAFLREGDGVVTTSKTVELGGKSYRLDHLCKVHDCAGNVLAVLWAPRGLRAWAALSEHGGTPVMFGDPTPEQSQALEAAAKGN